VTIRLDAGRDYARPDDTPYTEPSQREVYLQSHREGWTTFAVKSCTYLGEDGRPNGVVAGRAVCERDFASEAERAGFKAGFDQALRLYLQKVRAAIHAHFADY